MRETTLQKKSKAFAVRIIKMYQYLCDERHEFVLSKQVLRSGTSIGANVREAKRAQSRPDFYAKLFIALKEAEETEYWLELLAETEFVSQNMYESIYADCEEIIKLLVSSTKTIKEGKR
ncbi:MAG: four helix bundle protein [Paludibacteraceae bacterium]|nr:four helix bundle protein [Paludibacteraceae bacterium]